ncbi:hypothetical protein [Microtetraspora malaysiensis]|uniref:Uncharacterized protein n=1 Tax=Microtetraspora malaysiensis TaxID=161358 RepID=A0ABW6T2V2_9ACTN
MVIDSQQVVEHLEKLAAELENRRFAARVRASHGRTPHLQVINLAAPIMSETVFAAPDSDGAWAFHFPWPQLIALVDDIPAAADRIERVLAEVGR